MDTRVNQYNEYLYAHINNVKRSWKEMLRPAILYNLDEFDCTVEDLTITDMCIEKHDISKLSDDEFIPYLNYFYPEENQTKGDQDFIEEQFDYAWLLHQKRNPHHWQYYVLIKDSGKALLLDMPFEEICNMICDWHSFSAKDGTSTAYDWYSKNKDKMMLSNNTRKTVEKLIKYMVKPLV